MALGSTPLEAVKLMGYVPTVPAAGVPPRTPVLVFKVIPLGSAPLSEKVGDGVPVAVTVNDPAVPTVNVALAPLVMYGAGFPLNVVEPQINNVHAVMVVEPVVVSTYAAPRLLESFVMPATPVLEELHLAEASCWVLLSLNVPVAVNICVAPWGTEGFTGVTAIETKFGGV